MSGSNNSSEFGDVPLDDTTTTAHGTTNGGSSAPASVFLGPTTSSISQPTTPGAPPTPGVTRSSFVPLVCIVDFHHARGPEVERWFGVPDGFDPASEYDWSLLPFQALSDGAHASTEDFSYFTLLKPTREDSPATSLFGIACSRQLDAAQLISRPADVTRSTVQKAVVVIADSPQTFGMLRQRLSIVTCRWFEQREFTTVEILEGFQESLADDYRRGLMNEQVDRDQYLGMSLRELVREFREKTLILVKCCLLQHKMLFFGSRCERLCMIQFSLISLIPGLLRNLQDCAGPELNAYAENLKKATSLRTSDRNSLLSYLGMPLQIFGKGSLFGPYTPLQQLDILADHETKSYIVGSTNSLLLQQRDRYSDILINLDDNTVTIGNPALKEALQLTTPDRRWIDFITQVVNDTWDETNPGQPKDMGYAGSEEFIRIQFEEYLLNMASSVKYHNFLEAHPNSPRIILPHIEGDPSVDFGSHWIQAWVKTENYKLWDRNTDSHIFDVNDPKHPCAGGLSIDDVQRRLAQQVQDLHLDERFAASKEVLGRNFQAGKERASIIFNKLYADMEAMREAQRRRAEEARSSSQPASPGPASPTNGSAPMDLSKAHQTMQTVGAKASSYVSSWATWAGEKRKGWGRSSSSGSGISGAGIQSSNAGGWSGWGGGRSRKSEERSASSSFLGRRSGESGSVTRAENGPGASLARTRPLAEDSFVQVSKELDLSDDGASTGTAGLASPAAPPPAPMPIKSIQVDTTPQGTASGAAAGVDEEVQVVEKAHVPEERLINEKKPKESLEMARGEDGSESDGEAGKAKPKPPPTPQDEATKAWAEG